jgi:glucose/arabinose dehydrogenase
MKNVKILAVAVVLSVSASACAKSQAPDATTHPAYTSTTALTGQAALNTDWSDDIPGLSFHIVLSDLPAPYATPSAGNDPHLAPEPDGVMPQVPEGFAVDKVVTGLSEPRKVIIAPNGDIFICESGGNRIRVVRQSGTAAPTVNQVFADGLSQPFGMAFYPLGSNPQYLYVANTDSVVRFPYHNGDIVASGPSETLIDNVSGGGRLRGGGHWTRDIVFSKDGSKLFLSVGSKENITTDPSLLQVEQRRARIFEYNPDGTDEQVFATGIRNPVGIAINPETGELWMSVNERDGLGDNLVPDYISHVTPGGFYGWPWYWMGGSVDKRSIGDHPDLASQVITPDVILGPHSASLCMTFYKKGQFPRAYNGDAFACEHGSWNRSRRSGYKVIRVFMKKGEATGAYQDFMTGFVTPDGQVWGRPVGVAEALDGSLYITDDGTNTLWHVRYAGKE